MSSSSSHHSESPDATTKTTQGAPLLGRTSPLLSYFCVYNPSLGTSEESTKDQILYYTAKKAVPADVKMKQVGLAQALVNFSSAFSPSQPAQNVHSQKHRLVFYQPEPGFWMHMCVELGVLRKQVRDSKGREKLVTEYLDAQLNDRALEAILKVGYEQFKLFNGTMTSILYDPLTEGLPLRQRARSLMHSIEEFFSEWIWKWDFDRLDTMLFSAVFNGVPTSPIQQPNYKRILDLDNAIQSAFGVKHMFVLRQEELVYRSPSLSIQDIRALRKWICKKDEAWLAQKLESDKKKVEKKKKQEKVSGLKSLAKSISHSQILNFFSPKKDEEPPTDITATLPAPSEIPEEDFKKPCHGVYLAGLVEDKTVDMNGEEQTTMQIDLVRVYINSTTNSETPNPPDALEEYFILIYRHTSGLLWCFLLPTSIEEEEHETRLVDPSFYIDLENFMMEHDLESVVDAIHADDNNTSYTLSKNFRCLYYDNATLNMKSTLVDNNDRKEKPTGFTLTNDMVLQLLALKDDFESLTHTREVYTRSTANYWIAGRRIYKQYVPKRWSCESVDKTKDDHQVPPTEDDDDDDGRSKGDSEDYVEMYLVAAKKDTSLADVEENLRRMTTSVLDTMCSD